MSTGRLGAGDTAIQPTILDAKGDLIVATAADTPAVLSVGSANQVLTVDSSTATGLKWATAAAGGKVLQVVQGTTSTPVTNTGASYVDSGLTASITPSATSSKILVLVTQNMEIGGTEDAQATVKLVRGSTSLISDYYMEDYQQSRTASTQIKHIASLHYLDSPSTTSSTTYKTQIVKSGGTGITAQSASQTSTIILLEIGA